MKWSRKREPNAIDDAVSGQVLNDPLLWASANVSMFRTQPWRPPTPNRFSGSEFAMGTAVGVRSWDVDRLGRLVSPTYKTIWTPGEMVAECRAVKRYFLDEILAAQSVRDSDHITQEHRQSRCECGFYAYYHGLNEYADDERITGVIEGYGETQIGTRGFKSAKAKIVALHIPDEGRADFWVGSSAQARVRANYGEHVAIFDDYEQMVAEFPTSDPDADRTPESDPDFWTRSI